MNDDYAEAYVEGALARSTSAEFQWPEEIGDAYLLDDYMFDGNTILALAYRTTARRQVHVKDGVIGGIVDDPGKWGWELEADDGDCYYLGRPDDGAPVSWLLTIPATSVRLLQRRSAALPKDYR